MKQFLNGVVQWKTSTCLIFTASMFIYLTMSLLFDNSQVSTALLWTLFWVCAGAALLQGVCFSTWIFKKMRYTWRSLLFVALFLPALTLAAWKGAWFPMERAEAWIMFVGIFFLIFIGMTIGFEVGMFDLDFPCPGVATVRMQASGSEEVDANPSLWGTLTFVEK